MRENSKAALLYVPPVLALLAVWYGMLFIGNASMRSAVEMLQFSLTQGPQPNWFRWIFLLPIICAALGIAHISPIVRRKMGRVILVIAGVAVAGASWLTVSTEISIFVTLPVFFAVSGALRP